jgi:hypothetical protein
MDQAQELSDFLTHASEIWPKKMAKPLRVFEDGGQTIDKNHLFCFFIEF